MAYDKLNEYTDYLAKEFKRTMDIQVLIHLTMYYETVLQHGKFKGQRDYCRSRIYELNRPFAEGYFKKTDNAKRDRKK